MHDFIEYLLDQDQTHDLALELVQVFEVRRTRPVSIARRPS
jgi:hypothetical protein